MYSEAGPSIDRSIDMHHSSHSAPALTAAAFLLASLAAAVAVASAARRPRPRRRWDRETFDAAGAGGTKAIAEVKGERYARIEVVDETATGRGMGRCLVIDGRRQFCELDEHRHHEMLVHFPCAFLGPDRPRRALVVHGGDCLALRELLRYDDTLEEVVLLEEDERVLEVCERHLGARSTRGTGDARVKWMFGPTADSVSRLVADDGGEGGRLQAFDLIVVDGKERAGAQVSPQTARDLRLLLSPEGVVVVCGGTVGVSSAFEQMPSKVVYSFYSETHDAQTRMTAYSPVDLASRDEASAEGAGRHAQRLLAAGGVRFFDALQLWSYVPWFLR